MLFRFGKYNKLFKPNGLRSPGYLLLLNLNNAEAAYALDKIEFANKNGGRQKHLDRMFSGSNWRPHHVACCALLLDKEKQFKTNTLWERLKKGSWVTPQLVATVSLRDPEFESRIAELLKSLPAPLPTQEKIFFADLYPKDYLNDISLRYSKLINSLHAIMGYEAVIKILDKKIVDKAISKNTDSADKITIEWRAKIISLLQKRGIHY